MEQFDGRSDASVAVTISRCSMDAPPSDSGVEKKDGSFGAFNGGNLEKDGDVECVCGSIVGTENHENDFERKDAMLGGRYGSAVVIEMHKKSSESENGILGSGDGTIVIVESDPKSFEKKDGTWEAGDGPFVFIDEKAFVKDGSLDSGTSGCVVDKALDKKVGDGLVCVQGKKPAIPRTSCYHGVTRHRWTGKFEAHLWDGTINIESRKRKGKQGGYDSEQKAARAYDLAALKYWGAHSTTKLNFPISEYEHELDEMKKMTKDEWVQYLRRRSSCFSRGISAYRGVTRRQKDGRWQARLGSVAGTRDIYLGTFKTEEEAAVAYDIAAVELRGPNAVTNFDISNYLEGSFRRVQGEA
ncbi:AP2-like factor ANT lineage protein [Dioscorea alata]|uniref:AP2-like factor ANT lineage protein n=1 Tax=Dioscorea alata TaxID=55571 RepID=A0ACB7W8A4_DIOAL|nr:AP2-like factor ANT lineage protein [Dioscorea alata]